MSVPFIRPVEFLSNIKVFLEPTNFLMQRTLIQNFSIATLLVLYVLAITPNQTFAQISKPQAPAAAASPQAVLSSWPELKIPITNSVEDLTKFVSETKTLQPTTQERYLDMQKAILGASKRILNLMKDRSSPLFKAAEFDYYSSSVLLLGNEGPDAQRKTYERFRDYIQAKPKPDENDFKIILMTGHNLEQIPDGKLAREAYREFTAILKAKKISKDDKLMAVWIGMMDANAKRVELPGKVMDVQGKTITGEDFDIKSYRGKVTLVYFWASWEPSVKHEYLYMKKLYLDYREKGFEIVAVSVDDDREKLEAFIREYEVPWVNLWDEENRTAPVAATEHGISAIPTLILLDRDGKVVSLEARGLLLGKLLERYIDSVQPTQPQQATPKGK